MGPELVTRSEVSWAEKDKDHMVSLKCGILRNDTNELPYETETDSQTQQAKGKAVVGEG